jgi:hypothetical protein
VGIGIQNVKENTSFSIQDILNNKKISLTTYFLIHSANHLEYLHTYKAKLMVEVETRYFKVCCLPAYSHFFSKLSGRQALWKIPDSIPEQTQMKAFYTALQLDRIIAYERNVTNQCNTEAIKHSIPYVLFDKYINRTVQMIASLATDIN